MPASKLELDVFSQEKEGKKIKKISLLAKMESGRWETQLQLVRKLLKTPHPKSLSHLGRGILKAYYMIAEKAVSFV